MKINDNQREEIHKYVNTMLSVPVGEKRPTPKQIDTFIEATEETVISANKNNDNYMNLMKDGVLIKSKAKLGEIKSKKDPVGGKALIDESNKESSEWFRRVYKLY